MSSYLKADPRMTAQEQRQQAYREKYKHTHPIWDDSLVLLARLFRDQATPEMTVLDAGCGRSNYVLESNSSFIKHVTGFDATQEAVAGNTLAHTIVLGDLECLPFQENAFDSVVSLWVLEHLSRPDLVFAEIARVLKPSGRFFFVTPYGYSYLLLVKRIAGGRITRWILKTLYGRTEEDTFDTHYLANTEADLRALCARSGLKEITLLANEDPSYLAFHPFFFRIALLLQSIGRFLHLPFANMHLIGVYEKPSR